MSNGMSTSRRYKYTLHTPADLCSALYRVAITVLYSSQLLTNKAVDTEGVFLFGRYYYF